MVSPKDYVIIRMGGGAYRQERENDLKRKIAFFQQSSHAWKVLDGLSRRGLIFSFFYFFFFIFLFRN